EGVVELTEPRAAVFGRHRGVHQAQLPPRLEDVLGEARLTVALRGDGDDALPREPAGDVHEGFLFVGRLESQHVFTFAFVELRARRPPQNGSLPPTAAGHDPAPTACPDALGARPRPTRGEHIGAPRSDRV